MIEQRFGSTPMDGGMVVGRPGFTIKGLVVRWGFFGHAVEYFCGGRGEMMLSISGVVYGQRSQKSLHLTVIPLYCKIASLQIYCAYEHGRKYEKLAIIVHLAVEIRQTHNACRFGCGPRGIVGMYGSSSATKSKRVLPYWV